MAGQKRHEADSDQSLLFNSLFTLCEFDQLLRSGMRPERQVTRTLGSRHRSLWFRETPIVA